MRKTKNLLAASLHSSFQFLEEKIASLSSSVSSSKLHISRLIKHTMYKENSPAPPVTKLKKPPLPQPPQLKKLKQERKLVLLSSLHSPSTQELFASSKRPFAHTHSSLKRAMVEAKIRHVK